MGRIAHALARVRSVVTRTKAVPSSLNPLGSSGGWWPLIRESFAGAWQQNVTIETPTVLTASAVFACVTLIAADIGKLCLRLVVRDDDGVWTEQENPAYSPVLRKPNRYQTTIKFIEQWMTSKLIHGNTYVLKERDERRVVKAMYVLDPARVTPLVAPDGAVYYELRQDALAGVSEDTVVVPASEIIHDTMVTLYHPLIGVSPITACGLAALQQLKIQQNSWKFFATGSKPGGVLTAPGAISPENAKRIKDYWDANFIGDNVGKVAVLGDGLKYEAMAVNAVDAQLIEQLKWTGDNVCTAYHVPSYMVNIGPPPPYANIEPLLQQYYSQCLQSLINSFERCLDDGLGILERVNGVQYGVELDIDDLIWMNAGARGTAAKESEGTLTPNERRNRYFNAPAVVGGDSVHIQQQNYSLEALAKRDASKDPFAVNRSEPAPVTATDDPDDADASKSLDTGRLLELVVKGLAA